MKKYYFLYKNKVLAKLGSYLLVIPAISLVSFGFLIASAQDNDPFDKLTYPIPELGNCKSKTDCGTFCDKPENMEQCLTFGEAAGFMSADEAAMVRKTGGKGPGGCRGPEECMAYCEDPSHYEECVAFAGEMKGGEGSEGPSPGSPEGYNPPEGEGFEEGFNRPPTEDEMRAMEEKYRQQYEEEEYRRQMEQMSPSPGTGPEYGPPPEGYPTPEGIPESLLRNAKNFLANILSIFRLAR